MLKDYFNIIREALLQNRKKNDSEYYESHHIVPQSFKKKSITVLLTAKEHYRVHKILAEEFKDHPIYGTKMMWAFHRMTYNGKKELTEDEYSKARLILMKLWKRKKSESHKQKIGDSHKGKKWVLNESTGEYVQIDGKDLQKFLDLGWKNSHKFKENWSPTEEQKEKYSKAATKRQLGKAGEESRASKGAVVCENKITGEKIEAGSALQLSKKINIHHTVICSELNKDAESKPKTSKSKYYTFLQEHLIYYKN